MSAQHGIDTLPRVAGSRQVLEKTGLQIGPVGNGSLFVIADAGIHDDAAGARIHNQGVDTHYEISRFIHEVGIHPIHRFARLPGSIRENKPGATGHFHFNNAGNLYSANLPLIHVPASGTQRGKTTSPSRTSSKTAVTGIPSDSSGRRSKCVSNRTPGTSSSSTSAMVYGTGNAGCD